MAAPIFPELSGDAWKRSTSRHLVLTGRSRSGDHPTLLPGFLLSGTGMTADDHVDTTNPLFCQEGALFVLLTVLGAEFKAQEAFVSDRVVNCTLQPLI